MGLVVNENRRAHPGYESFNIPTTQNPQKEIASDIIKHELINLLGETTNILIFCYVDNNMPQIQTGKAAVNYWIDRLVERDSLSKQHSKPVLFWRSARYSTATRHEQMYHSGVGR